MNSSYIEQQRPEVRGSRNSQTIAAQINYDAKQAYLDKIESEAQARASANAKSLISYTPDQVGYVELSTDHGLSASVKGMKVIADNKVNVPRKNSEDGYAVLVGAIAFAVAAAITIAVSSNNGGLKEPNSNPTCTSPNPPDHCENDP